MKKIQTETHIHMPDLLFSRFCEEEYKLRNKEKQGSQVIEVGIRKK